MESVVSIGCGGIPEVQSTGLAIPKYVFAELPVKESSKHLAISILLLSVVRFGFSAIYLFQLFCIFIQSVDIILYCTPLVTGLTEYGKLVFELAAETFTVIEFPLIEDTKLSIMS